MPEIIGLAEFKVRHDALRAVVELHKTYESMQGTACLECSEDEYACLYPCPTIQAIEKELV